MLQRLSERAVFVEIRVWIAFVGIDPQIRVHRDFTQERQAKLLRGSGHLLIRVLLFLLADTFRLEMFLDALLDLKIELVLFALNLLMLLAEVNHFFFMETNLEG